jgi:AcrR family transcriptional regulator
MSSPSHAPGGRVRILEAALALILRRRGADVTMAEIARAARLSRQALYLHFRDRGQLLLALVRYADERRRLGADVKKIIDAPDAVTSLRLMVAMQARMNPGVWAVARAFDAVRRRDPAAERSWQDRLRSRLDGCRRIIARVVDEGLLRQDLHADAAADLLWTLTSMRTWEELVIERGWSAAEYQKRVTKLVLTALIAA